MNDKKKMYCGNCFKPISQNENVAHRANQIENAISDVCCMNCFCKMEDDRHDYC